MTSAAHWPTNLSCSLAYWPQLLIGLMTLAAHWPTDLSCLLAFGPQLPIGLLTSAPNLLSDLSFSLAWMDVILLFCNHQNKVLQLYSFNRIYWSFWSCFVINCANLYLGHTLYNIHPLYLKRYSETPCTLTPANMLTPNMEESASPVIASPIRSLRPILWLVYRNTLYYIDFYLNKRRDTP